MLGARGALAGFGRWWVFAVAGTLLAGLCGQPLAAQERPAARVARLIEKLGSDSYSERRRADAELAKLGPESRLQLQQAALSEKPEVRLRARALLGRLALVELWSPSTVTYHAPGAKASAAMRAIAIQTENRLLVGDQYRVFDDKPIDADYRHAPFWKVVDEICRQTGNHVRPHYNTSKGTLVVVSGEPGKFPVAYSGPLRAQVTGARRTFIEEYDYEDGSSDITHTFQLNVQVMWEDRFRLLAYRSQPGIVSATTNAGVQLSAAQVADRSWNVAGGGMRQLTATLQLHPPPVTARTLDRLALRWDLIAVGDMKTIDVTDFDSRDVHRRDDLELTVEEFEHAADDKYVVTLAIARDLVIPEPHDVLFYENRIELLDAQGKPLRKDSQSNARTDKGARVKLTFLARGGAGKPATLRLHYPRIRSQRALDIVFRDVPLPTARPE